MRLQVTTKSSFAYSLTSKNDQLFFDPFLMPVKQIEKVGVAF